MRKLLIASLLLAGPVPALAQGQADMSVKAEADYRQADAQMTATWRQVAAAMMALDAQNTSRGGGFGFFATALDVQRQWLTYRDRQCSIEAAIFQGGSMGPMIGAQCKTRLTRERTADLRAVLADNK